MIIWNVIYVWMDEKERKNKIVETKAPSLHIMMRKVYFPKYFVELFLV